MGQRGLLDEVLPELVVGVAQGQDGDEDEFLGAAVDALHLAVRGTGERELVVDGGGGFEDKLDEVGLDAFEFVEDTVGAAALKVLDSAKHGLGVHLRVGVQSYLLVVVSVVAMKNRGRSEGGFRGLLLTATGEAGSGDFGDVM